MFHLYHPTTRNALSNRNLGAHSKREFIIEWYGGRRDKCDSLCVCLKEKEIPLLSSFDLKEKQIWERALLVCVKSKSTHTSKSRREFQSIKVEENNEMDWGRCTTRLITQKYLIRWEFSFWGGHQMETDCNNYCPKVFSSTTFLIFQLFFFSDSSFHLFSLMARPVVWPRLHSTRRLVHIVV